MRPAADPERLPRVPADFPHPHPGAYQPQLSLFFEESHTELGALLWGPGEYEHAMSIEPALTEWDESEFWGDGVYPRKLPGLSAAESVLGQLARNTSLGPGNVEKELRRFPGHARALVPVRGARAANPIVGWLGRFDTTCDFRALLLEHPVLAPHAVRLVWQADDGEHRTGFRIAEDGGFTDVRERPFEPSETAVIRLAHPATLGDEYPGWVEIFTDYAILQPFEQLSRQATAFTAEEAETGRLRRFEGATATMGALRKLMEWKRLERPVPRGTVPVRRFERALPGGHLLAGIDPGSDAAAPGPNGRHRITSLWLSTTRNRRPGAAKPLRGDRLDPITASELLAGFAEATGDR
jgi:hypothetical protein